MTVQIVTDSSSCLPEHVARRLGVTVLDLHLQDEEGSAASATTAGLSSLELTAAYARQLALGNDEGVLALHLSKHLSSTFSHAEIAAGVFPGNEVVAMDTLSIAMNLGVAAGVAGYLAGEGKSLAECEEAARKTLDNSLLWCSVARTDALRKSGRLSATNALMSQALATRPILSIKDGKIEIAAKTRTQAKALSRMVDAAVAAAEEQPVFAAIQHANARKAGRIVLDDLTSRLPEGSAIIAVEMDPILAVHAGEGAVALTIVRDEDVARYATEFGAITVQPPTSADELGI